MLTDFKRRLVNMPINDRNLKGGEKLVARYKGQEHTVLVLADDKGGLGFELDGDTIHKSLSAAGSAVMGGVACNGWRFWSPEGELKQAAPKEPKAKANGKARTATVRNLKKISNQKGVPPGQIKWHCSSCQKSFLALAATAPEACPEGHAREVEDELAPVS